MDANEYFKRGRESLEKDDYDQACADFWKVMEMMHEPEKVEMFREQTKVKGFEPDVVALVLMESLKQFFQ